VAPKKDKGTTRDLTITRDKSRHPTSRPKRGKIHEQKKKQKRRVYNGPQEDKKNDRLNGIRNPRDDDQKGVSRQAWQEYLPLRPATKEKKRISMVDGKRNWERNESPTVCLREGRSSGHLDRQQKCLQRNNECEQNALEPGGDEKRETKRKKTGESNWGKSGREKREKWKRTFQGKKGR